MVAMPASLGFDSDVLYEQRLADSQPEQTVLTVEQLNARICESQEMGVKGMKWGVRKTANVEPQQSKVYRTPDDLEKAKGWGGEYWYHEKGHAEVVKGMPISKQALAAEHPVLFHVTTNLAAIEGSGYLRAGSTDTEGGLGSSFQDPAVSFTYSRQDAINIQRELIRAGDLSRSWQDTDAVKAKFAQIAKEDEQYSKLPEGTLDKAVVGAVDNYDSHNEWSMENKGTPTRNPLEAYGLYLHMRETRGGAENPLLIGGAESFAKVRPENVGILSIPTENVPDKALIRRFINESAHEEGRLPKRDFLHEIQVDADVPIKGAKVIALTREAREAREARIKEARLRRFGESHKLHYKTEFQDLPISVENRKGSVREGTDPKTGKPWRTKMKNPYGYIRGTRGVDGDSVDVYLGPEEEAGKAFVVHQKDPETGKFDEDKVMLGFPSKTKARKAFLKHYDDPDFLGPISAIPMPKLKKKLKAKKAQKLVASSRLTELDVLALEQRLREAELQEHGIKGQKWGVHKFQVHVKRDYSKYSEAKYDTNKKRWLTTAGKPLPKHIQACYIPPAWQNVRYSNDPGDDLLVSGRDKKGVGHAVYSAKFNAQQANSKFERVSELDRKYNRVLASVVNDIRIGKNVEEASILRLVMTTGLRPGSEKQRGAVKAYGATTLEGRHVIGKDESSIRLRFVGKKGVKIDVPVTDHDVARDLLKRRGEAGPLGRIFNPGPGEAVRSYSNTQDGGGFKTKDFRTLLGTRVAQAERDKLPPPKTEKEYRVSCKAVAKIVSEKLGNTPNVALKAYIAPHVFAGWRVGKGWRVSKAVESGRAT